MAGGKPVGTEFGFSLTDVVFLGRAFLLSAILAPWVFRLLKRKIKYEGKHVLVTGGSQGIGLTVALEFARQGANITLLARTEHTLKTAVEQVKKVVKDKGQKVEYVVADVSDYAAMQKACASAATKNGDVDVLIANAGLSIPGYLLEQDPGIYNKQMQVNYMGVVHAVKCIAPHMCERREGQIVIVASAAAAISLIGYSSYAPTKWALRGFADAIRNEFCGFNVSVHIAYPPDTQTPGFQNENKGKPRETKQFSEQIGGAAYKPEAVAKKLIGGMAVGMYHLPSPDFLQNRLIDVMSGVSPKNNLVLETLMGLLLNPICWAVRHILDYYGFGYGQRLLKASGPKSKKA